MLFHFGSLLLGAQGHWSLRWVRAIGELVFLPCGGCCGGIDKKMMPHNIYNDIIIRSTDYPAADVRATAIMDSHKVVKNLKGSLVLMSLLGVVTSSSIATLICYSLLQAWETFSSPKSYDYVPNMMATCVLCWITCAFIAYSAIALFDVTADTLLYCYGWNRKYNKKNVENYIPETLRYLVGFDDGVGQDKYPYYGKANKNMYLSTFMPTKPKKKWSEKKAAGATGATMYDTAGGTGMDTQAEFSETQQFGE